MRHGFSWMDMSTVRILYHMYYCMRSHFFTLKVGYVIPFWSGKLWSKFFSIQLIQLLIKSLKIPSSMLYYSNPLVCSSSWRRTLLLVSARQCNMPYIKWEWDAPWVLSWFDWSQKPVEPCLLDLSSQIFISRAIWDSVPQLL